MREGVDEMDGMDGMDEAIQERGRAHTHCSSFRIPHSAFRILKRSLISARAAVHNSPRGR